MGVAGLQSWLKRRYPEAFVPLPAEPFDHVYIDMSSTLHQVIRRARTKTYFHQLLHRRLDEILAVAQPRRRVVLALDGPAPLAKLLEQRRRRRRESEKAARLEAAAAAEAEAAAQAAASSSSGEWSSTVDALDLKGTWRPPNPELSTLALTTGSRLMLDVHASLAAYICKKLEDPAWAHLRRVFELSDSTVKGEGELKIHSRLLHPSAGGAARAAAASSAAGAEETHLVLGADSDLLLMALVAGQRGVYIIGDLEDSAAHQHRHRKKKRGGRRDGAALATAAADAPSAILASSSGESSGSESEAEGLESDTEAESDAESDAEVPAGAALLASSAPPQLAGIAAAAAGAEPPPPLAFSRDAAERLWREQHLGIAGSAQGQQAVTALALDLMLLSVLSSGNDYLPAIQGTQLSNKHRPGLWDLYLSLRRQPAWEGQCLVVRTCECDGSSGGSGAAAAGGADCPSPVRLNTPMVEALLTEYYRQRYVYFDQGPPAGLSSVDASSSGSFAGSVSGSMDGGGGGGGRSSGISSRQLDASVVWDAEGLAAAAEAADQSVPPGQQKRSMRPMLQGADADPDAYVQGLEWVLGMYCSGAVRDYRFTYSLAAPSLPELLAHLGATVAAEAQAQQQQQQQQAQQRRQGGAGGMPTLAPPPRRRSLQPLLPAACAMALLPRGGRMHAASALQHLMDEGGELDGIYAVCDECGALGQRLGSLARELDAKRAALASAQLRQTEAAASGDEGPAALAAAEVQQLSVQVSRLRSELSNVSRTQQEHVYQAHPYQPFPTEALEAAVAAVPLARYTPRERRLVQFGREFVYSRAPAGSTTADSAGAGGTTAGGDPRLAIPMTSGGGERRRQGVGAGGAGARRQREVAAAAAPSSSSLDSLASTDELLSAGAAGSGSDSEGAVEAPLSAAVDRAPAPPRVPLEPLQPWVRDALAFVTAYPRMADPQLIRRANVTVQRSVLPLRPYMQPTRVQRLPDGTMVRPSALLAECGIAAAAGPGRQQGAGLLGRGSRVGRRGALAYPLQPLQRAPLHTCTFGGSMPRAAAAPRVPLMLAGRGLLRLLRAL